MGYIKRMGNCIFCKIGKSEIPCYKISENKNFMVFLDIKPVSFGHLLIIPKKHIVWMQEAEDEIISDIFILAKKMMFVLKKALSCDYVQMSVVGEEVPHFHVHLIPRYRKDGFRNLPTIEYKKDEAEKILKKIIQAL